MFEKLLSFFREDDRKPESEEFVFVPTDTLDKEAIKAIVRRWLLYIDAHETVPADIVALNFNLWEAAEENGDSCYTLELTGSRHYDA